MRVLLDEQLPRHLARELTGHEVRTVQQQGWAGLTNGELLRRAVEAGFQTLVTADQSLEFQQNPARLGLGVIVLAARTSSPHAPAQILRCAQDDIVTASARGR